MEGYAWVFYHYFTDAWSELSCLDSSYDHVLTQFNHVKATLQNFVPFQTVISQQEVDDLNMWLYKSTLTFDQFHYLCLLTTIRKDQERFENTICKTVSAPIITELWKPILVTNPLMMALFLLLMTLMLVKLLHKHITCPSKQNRPSLPPIPLALIVLLSLKRSSFQNLSSPICFVMVKTKRCLKFLKLLVRPLCLLSVL